jgi:hypothetical protein
MAAFSKPHIEISLEGSQGNSDAYINSFSTLDRLRGVVRITARHDTRFDELEIALQGECDTVFWHVPECRACASDHTP